MPLQVSGPISLDDIHVEAGGVSGAQCSINDADIRGLITKAIGAQSSFNEFYGASAGSTLTDPYFYYSPVGSVQYLGYNTAHPDYTDIVCTAALPDAFTKRYIVAIHAGQAQGASPTVLGTPTLSLNSSGFTFVNEPPFYAENGYQYTFGSGITENNTDETFTVRHYRMNASGGASISYIGHCHVFVVYADVNATLELAYDESGTLITGGFAGQWRVEPAWSGSPSEIVSFNMYQGQNRGGSHTWDNPELASLYQVDHDSNDRFAIAVGEHTSVPYQANYFSATPRGRLYGVGMGFS